MNALVTVPKPVRSSRMRKVLHEWLELKAMSTKQHTLDAYARRLDLFVSWMERKHIGLASLDREQILGFIKYARNERGWSNNHLRMMLTNFKSFFDYACELGVCLFNPFRSQRLPVIKNQEIQKIPFTFHDYQLLLAEANKLKPTWTDVRRYPSYWAPAIQIAWSTGLRFSDIATLQWSSVHFDKEVLIVNPMKLSGFGQQLTIPLEPETVNLFLRLQVDRIVDSPYVLPCMAATYLQPDDRGRRMMVARFRLLCVAANVKGSFHSFRHAFVTRLINAGVEPMVIGSMTGQSIDTIKRYAHISVDTKRGALELSRKAMHAARLQQLSMRQNHLVTEI